MVASILFLMYWRKRNPHFSQGMELGVLSKSSTEWNAW